MAFIKRKALVLFWFSKANLKMMLVSLVGLVIALSMIAGCLYNTEFARQDLYLELLELEGVDKLDFETAHFRSNYEDTIDYVKSVEYYLEQKIDQRKLSGFLGLSPFSPSSFLDHNVIFQNQTYHRLISGHSGLNESIIEECVPTSRFPVDQTEILVYAPENSTLAVDDEINITIRYYSTTGGGRQSYNMTLTIAGLLKNSALKSDSFIRNYQKNDLFHGIFDFDQCFFFSSLDNFYSLVQQIKQELESEQPIFYITSLFIVDIDVANIDHTNAIKTINSIHDFILELNELDNNGKINLHSFYSNPMYSDFFHLLIGINSFFISFIIISSPVLIIVILLVFFSLGLVNERKKKTLALMITRGVSSRFIFFILSVEIIIIALIATSVSAIIGVPLAQVIGASNGFLAFHKESAFVVVVELNTFLTLFLLGTGLTFLGYLPSMFNLSRKSVAALQQEVSKKAKRKVGVLRSQIDVLLIFCGLAGMIIFNFFLELARESKLPEGTLSLFLPFIFIILFFSPLFVLTGSLMSYNRFIPVIIQRLGRFFWDRNLRSMSIAIRNLSVNIKVTTRITMLIAITMSFLIVLAILPVSLYQHHVDTAYYNNGADIWITMRDEPGNNVTELTSSLESVDGLTVTRICRSWHYVYPDQPDLKYEVTFLGISSDFSTIAHWQDHYDDDILKDMVTALFAGEDNAVLVDSKTAREKNISLYNNHSVFLGDQDPINVTPVAITNYFPWLIKESWSEIQYFICKESFITELRDKEEFGIHESILGRIDSGHDPLTITGQIREILEYQGYHGNQVISVPENLAEARDSTQENLLWLVINYNYLAALITAIAALIMFMLSRMIINKREIALGRALGLKNRQLFLLTFIEPLLLFLLSAIPGTIIGAFILMGLAFFYGPGEFLTPPLVLDFNLPVILSMYGLLITVMVLFGMITSVSTTRTSVAEILKAEG